MVTKKKGFHPQQQQKNYSIKMSTRLNKLTQSAFNQFNIKIKFTVMENPIQGVFIFIIIIFIIIHLKFNSIH